MISISRFEKRSLIETTWNLTGRGGEVLAANLALMNDGTIRNAGHPNESRWEWEYDRLLFIGKDGSVTSVFDRWNVDETLRRQAVGVYTGDGRPHILEENVAPRLRKPPHSDVAVLVRAHSINDKLINLINLIDDSEYYDVYLVFDETNKSSGLDRSDSILHHRVDDFKALDLCKANVSNYLWFLGDYPFYLASRHLKNHNYFVLFEFDIDIQHRNRASLEILSDQIRKKKIDFAGPHFGNAGPDWAWAATASKKFSSVHTCLFPLICLSRPAIDFLYKLRVEEASAIGEIDTQFLDPSSPFVFCEAFVASAMANSSFSHVDLNRILKRAYDHDTFHVRLPHRLGAKNTTPDVAFLHPVIPYDDFLTKHIAHAVAHKDDTFIRQVLDDPDCPPPVRRRLEATIIEIRNNR